MKFEYLEDVAIADIAFKAQGKDMNELFENAALATAETMMDTKSIKQKLVKEISLNEEDIEQLLFSFLSEIIYLKDAELHYFLKFDFDGFASSKFFKFEKIHFLKSKCPSYNFVWESLNFYV